MIVRRAVADERRKLEGTAYRSAGINTDERLTVTISPLDQPNGFSGRAFDSMEEADMKMGGGKEIPSSVLIIVQVNMFKVAGLYTGSARVMIGSLSGHNRDMVDWESIPDV